MLLKHSEEEVKKGNKRKRYGHSNLPATDQEKAFDVVKPNLMITCL